MAEGKLTVIGHLDELRKRIIISIAALLCSAVISFPFSSAILAALKLPARGALERLVYFGPEEPLLVYMRVSIIAGLIISFPVIAYQAWAFAAPALGDKSKKLTVYFVSASAAAFAAGCAFAFFALLPAALRFLLSIGTGELEPVISASRYISFVTGSMLACGIVFEMPVATFFLARAGLVSAGLMRRKFKYALVAIIVAAAVITPTTDIFNMTLLAVPMFALYEASIWVAFFASKRSPGYVQ
jgi:sec-independent protein translocase protein TatC